nr:hypothetical protein [Tanacetum cinerariifolium]GEX99593.1 hypothetical protein [Tanacetum cinerariifolium]
TLSNYTSTDDEDETNVESKVKNKAVGDEDKGMDYTTNQFDNDVDVRLNDPVNTDEDAEIVSPMDVHVYYEVLSNQTPTLLTVPVSSYDLAKSLFSTYDKVYSLKRSQKDKDKDEDPFAGSDRRLKKRKTSKDVEPKKKACSCRGTSMPQNQEENLGNDDEEPKRKTPQQGPTESWLMTLVAIADKPLKIFDELMSTPIDFFTYIMNGLKVTNLTQETLVGPAFKLFKGTRTNFAKLKYDFEECYKALSEKLDWDNPEGGDYPFYLTKPLPLVMNGNRQIVPVDYFFNNDLKYLQGGISTTNYTTSIMKTKAAQYDILGIKYMRRWSSSKKKRAHNMIKAIDKQLKETGMMRSFEKFDDSILQAGNPINEILLKLNLSVTSRSSQTQRINVILQDVQAPVETNCATEATNPIVKPIHWKSFGEDVSQLVISLDKIQFNRTLFYVLLYEMVANNDEFGS